MYVRSHGFIILVPYQPKQVGYVDDIAHVIKWYYTTRYLLG